MLLRIATNAGASNRKLTEVHVRMHVRAHVTLSTESTLAARSAAVLVPGQWYPHAAECCKGKRGQSRPTSAHMLVYV